MSLIRQIPRTDLAGMLAWLESMLGHLDAQGAGMFQRRNDSGELLSEIECAWDEEPMHRRLAFPKRDENKQPIIKPNGRPELVFGVKLAKRRLSFYEQAVKLVGMGGSKLASWRDDDGLQDIAAMLQRLRGAKESYRGALSREALAERQAERTAALMKRLASMSQAERRAEERRLREEAEAKPKPKRVYRRHAKLAEELLADDPRVKAHLERMYEPDR